MPRLKTSNLKEVVISARRQRATDKAIEKERARKELAISQRYSVIWKILYAAALDGKSGASVQNLDLDDIKFFENQQLTVELQYERKQEFEEIDTLIKQKKKEIATLSLALGRLKTDFEDMSDLGDGSLELLRKISELLRANGDRAPDYTATEESIEVHELALQTLTEETAELEASEDYSYGAGIETTHLINWRYIKSKSLQKKTGFSSAGLLWFSSRSGQQTMENFEHAVLGLAKAGKQSMAVKCSLPVSDDTEVEIVNSSWGFRTTFLSLFDFEMAMNILGYKVERKAEVGNVMGLIIKW